MTNPKPEESVLIENHEYSFLLALLKACARSKDFSHGSRLHADILKRGLFMKNLFIGNTLVSMYAKCGAVAKAQQVFNDLSDPDVVSWTALIAGYAEHKHGEEALCCFEKMQGDGLSPNAVTFLCILKACASIGASQKGEQIHFEITKTGLLATDCALGTALVDMYARCGVLLKAYRVFDELPLRDVVSWNALIAGSCLHGHLEEALNCLELMKYECLSPNLVTFSCILGACGSIGAVEEGNDVLVEIIRQGLPGKDSILATALVDMYFKCGALARAQQAFDELQVRDLVSWNVLIAGYCLHEHDEEVINAFEQMKGEGISPDVATFSSILRACGSMRDLDKGTEIHNEIMNKGMLRKDNVLGSMLVHMYAKCGVLAKAQQLLDALGGQNVVSWNALIAGYCEHGHAEEALKCFQWMKDDCVHPNTVTFACIVKACAMARAAEKGKEIHEEIVTKGLLEKDIVLGNALVDMYANFGALGKAQEVFHALPARDVVSWNVLITGYCHHGYDKEALTAFESMKQEGLAPNSVTFACVLNACGSLKAAEKGTELHNDMTRLGLLEKNGILRTALVDMYSKCGGLERAQQVFTELPRKDIGTWNALIAGYCEHGHSEEAITCFNCMKRDGFSVDEVTMACLLKACGSIGAGEKGMEIHAEIVRKDLLGCVYMLGVALVDMYAKCGSLGKAQEVLDKLPARDVVSWTALLGGYAHEGKHDIVIDKFTKMRREGIEPNWVTFIVLLNACSYLGSAHEGQSYFEIMSTRYGIVPTFEHHVRMMDLYGLVGNFDEAFHAMRMMPSTDHFPLSFTVLNACRKFGNVDFGRLVFEHVEELGKRCGVPYVYLNNICAGASMQDHGKQVEAF